MKVSEKFYSIQGEGRLIGTPSTFIRTSYCNLRCDWCDTPYTSWQPEDKEESVDDLVDYVKSRKIPHVVITGGEPTIQKELGELCERLEDYHITIETNGTIYTPYGDLISLSPKLSNSTPMSIKKENHERQRINLPVLERFVERGDYQLKYVISNDFDIKEALELTDRIKGDRDKVYFMPEGRNEEELKEKQVWLAERCLDLGVKYSPRLHINIWGDKRGT